MSNCSRFHFYIKEEKKGIIDVLTKKIILHHNYDVKDFNQKEIFLNDNSVLLFKDVLRKIDFISSKQRFMIVEEINSKKIGIFDNRKQVMIIPCEYDKIEYVYGVKGFVLIKNNKIKNISFDKLMKLDACKGGCGLVSMNNLSLYCSKPFCVDLKSGQKINFDR